MQRDLGVGARLEAVPVALELGANALEVVELAVVNEVELGVFVRDRLVAGREVDDAQPGVAESRAGTGVDPDALGVGTAMIETPGRAMERVGGDAAPAGNSCNDAAHMNLLLVGDEV